jgi:hypothetical protein
MDYTDNDSEACGASPEVLFPEFHKIVTESILKLGGACMAKLGGNSAKDAVWINTENSLKCRTASDVYELLKSSDRVALNVDSAKVLTLKKWLEIDPSMEFRCFIRNGNLVAISQRDDTVFYQHLCASKNQIGKEIEESLSLHVIPHLHWDTCVVDVYMTSSKINRIIDISAWDEKETSSILFEWQDLNSFTSTSPMFKVIESDENCRLGIARYNSMPVDLIESDIQLDDVIRGSIHGTLS